MVESIVKDWIKGTERDLVKSYRDKGLSASGNWEKELESVFKISKTNVNIKFLGSSYTQYLEVPGRGPNKNQDPVALRAFVGWAGSTFLKDWVERKGISANPFCIACKIAREGIPVPNKNNPGGLVSDVINKTTIQELAKRIGDFYINEIRTDLKSIKI